MKRLKSWLLISGLCASLILPVPRQSHAIVGLATLATPAGVPFLIAGGAALASGGLLLGIRSIICANDNCPDGMEAITGLALLVALVGVVLLDDDQGSYLKFAPIDSKEAAELGLSQDESRDFNLYNDELNSVSQAVGAELRAMPKAGVEDSQALWEKYRASIPSDAAFTAAAKVSARWIQPVVQR